MWEGGRERGEEVVTGPQPLQVDQITHLHMRRSPREREIR